VEPWEESAPGVLRLPSGRLSPQYALTAAYMTPTKNGREHCCDPCPR